MPIDLTITRKAMTAARKAYKASAGTKDWEKRDALRAAMYKADDAHEHAKYLKSCED